MARGERLSWRKIISKKLEVRDRVEWHCFKDIIREHNKLFENADTAKSRVVQLEIQVAQLQQERQELHGRVQELSLTGGGGGGGGGSEKIAGLEQKLFKLQEELTELHRQKGENAQKLMELNNALRRKEQDLVNKEGQFQDLTSNKQALDKECQRLQQTILELDSTCQMVKDELQALQLAYTALEARHRKTTEENQDLIARWMAQKAKAADEINAQNENQLRLRQEKLRKDLVEAAKEPVVNIPSNMMQLRQEKLRKDLVEAAKEPVVNIPSNMMQLRQEKLRKDLVEAAKEPVVNIPSNMMQLRQEKLRKDLVEAAKEPVVNIPSNMMQLRQEKLRKDLVEAAKEPVVNIPSNMMQLRQEKLRKDLVEAAKEPVVNIPSNFDQVSMAPFCAIVSVPSYPDRKFDAHDSEVHAARFSLSGRLFATGGADRRVKIWELVNGIYLSKGIMHGSNAGIMSVQFDPQEKLILAASHEGACRVWTLADQRLRHTLTGHSQKVMSAKFLGAATKVVSGGHDRTLKIWDLRSRQCTRTIFAGSSCNDIVINEGIGSQVASGHLDKTVRFWDVRTENQSSVGEITLQGKITSLDLSPDMNCMLASARDDTVKLLDLRMNQVMSTCSADGFKVAVDYTRASFSPDGQFVICGSQDGSIFVWDASTAKLEKILKEHTSSVVVCAWHPDGSSIVSCDRNKRAIVWTNRY